METIVSIEHFLGPSSPLGAAPAGFLSGVIFMVIVISFVKVVF